MRILEELWYGNIEPNRIRYNRLQGIQRSTPFDYQERGKTSCYHDR